MWWRVSSGQVPIRMVSGAPPDFDGVVGHQPVAADDQVERAFALADAALAGDQHAEAEDVHQHGVDDGALGEPVLENRARAWRWRSASAATSCSSGSRARSRLGEQLRRRREARR